MGPQEHRTESIWSIHCGSLFPQVSKTVTEGAAPLPLSSVIVSMLSNLPLLFCCFAAAFSQNLRNLTQYESHWKAASLIQTDTVFPFKERKTSFTVTWKILKYYPVLPFFYPMWFLVSSYCSSENPLFTLTLLSVTSPASEWTKYLWT